MRWTLLALSLLAAAAAAAEETPYELPEPPVSTAAVYSADYFEYVGSTTGVDANILLKGNVELEDSSWTLRADELRLDMGSRVGRAHGTFELDDGLTVLRGESGTFDFESKSGSVDGVRAEYHPWRVWAKSGRLDSNRKGHFKKALFTSCDGNPPDYHFRSSGLHIKPGKWLVATNVRFYAGPVPIFYTPILWKSLKKNRILRARTIPGYDRRNGAHLRTHTMFSPVPWIAGKLFLDYYGSQGFAQGAEAGFRPSEDLRGGLYGYRIRERHSGDQRWTVIGNTYATLNSSYSVQGRIQAQGDPEVNNHYVRSNAFRVTSELVNGGAITRRTSLTTTRIAYSRLDRSNPAGDGFRLERESLPRLEFQTSQLSFRRLPALFTVTAFADNAFERARDFQQKSAGVGVEGTQTKLLAPGVSLTPRAAFRQEFEDKRQTLSTSLSTQTFRDVFIAYYEYGGNLRFDTPIGDWDARYAFTQRMKPNRYQDDAGSLDHGVEQNLVSLQNTIRPHRRVFMRVGTGYDFRTFRHADMGFRDRVKPFTTDLNFDLRRGLSLSLRDAYSLDNGNEAFLAQLDWGERDEDFFSAGLTHTHDRASSYFASTEAGWAPKGSSWRFQGALRYVLETPGGFDTRGFRVFEKEAAITRKFHDFFAKVLARFRPGGVKEVQLRVELRTDRPAILRKAAKRWEKEWFPWRGADDERD
jgi:hypothetical protein